MSNAYWGLSSTIGKKVLMGLTGLALVGFVIGHLAGNLLLLSPNPDHFNRYAHTLESMGVLLYLAEAGLALVFGVHIYNGVRISIHNRRARPVKYRKGGNAGGVSKKNTSSVSMIWTGLILFAFLIWHLAALKFGGGVEAGYVTRLQGVDGPVRDLYRLVVERFSEAWFSGLYVLVMILLGVHLRHGFWSAFQSLGANHPRYMPLIRALGIGLALLLAVGFLFIPVWIYVTGGAQA
ncbi:MAG TPA: succinate dehydrogenase cytochrome b subunit [Acidobacteriota bacterium]|nr:succinate dehydrogenase cytochrome b subunit [Acidobacteriota bacterium]